MEKNILITGASSGIGRETAFYLHSKGYRVVLLARNIEKLKQLSRELGNSPIIEYDLNNLVDIESIFLKLQDMGLKLDGMVHCAGINRDMPVKANELHDMLETMNINLLSFIQLSKFFCLKRYSNNDSSVIAMSSIAAISCDKSMCTYSASKAGLDAAVRVMSKEFARRKIRVNSIQPTFVDTPMLNGLSETQTHNQPLGIINPVNVAYLIEFLLSDKSAYISGSNIKMSSAIM